MENKMNENNKELAGIFKTIRLLANKFKKHVMKIDIFSIICLQCRKRSQENKNAQPCKCGMVI